MYHVIVFSVDRDEPGPPFVREAERARRRKTFDLGDFAPRSERSVPVPEWVGKGFHWRVDYSTHSGLPMAATGGHPISVERDVFLERIKGRDTYRFLREIFDAQVVAADGRTDVTTLSEIEREDGVLPVVLKKPNGTVYLTVFHRRKPQAGWYHDGVSVDVAFQGTVSRVDPLTGEPLSTLVSANPVPGGLRFTGLRVPYFPRNYTERAKVPIDLPVYKITP